MTGLDATIARALDGKPGTLVSFPDAYLGIRLDGDKHTSRCHPTWRIEREAKT